LTTLTPVGEIGETPAVLDETETRLAASERP
jgi:hypothetical protein